MQDPGLSDDGWKESQEFRRSENCQMAVLEISVSRVDVPYALVSSLSECTFAASTHAHTAAVGVDFAPFLIPSPSVSP